MGYQNFLQHLNVVVFTIVVVGCTDSTGTPIALATTTPSPISTEVQTITLDTTPTSVEVSSFEECITSSGSRLDGTYPRQCITKNGIVFNETPDEGIIYSKTYGTQGVRTGYFITSTSDGGHLVAGALGGCWILKLSASGEKEWEASFNQELSQEFELQFPDFVCRLARETPDGGYAAMGITYDTQFGQYRKHFMLTLDHEGNKLSAQILPKKGEKIPFLDRDGKLIWLTSLGLTTLRIPREVNETLDGGYIIVSTYEQSDPDSSKHMIKTDKNGGYVWDKNLCRDKNIQQEWEKSIACSYGATWDVIQLQDGSFVVTGGSWLLKTDAQGNIIWIQSFPPDFGTARALLQIGDDGILVAGEKDVDEKQTDGVLIRIDSAGNLQWIKSFGGDQNDGFMALEKRPNGEVIVMGWTESFEAGTRLWLLGIDSTRIK